MWREYGEEKRDCSHIYAIAINSKDNVYVNDKDHGNIQKFKVAKM
jgi:hypothetical protein